MLQRLCPSPLIILLIVTFMSYQMTSQISLYCKLCLAHKTLKRLAPLKKCVRYYDRNTSEKKVIPSCRRSLCSCNELLDDNIA